MRKALVYPPGLPAPTAASLQAAERRLLTSGSGLRESRPFSRDRGGAQPVQFVLSTQEQVSTWLQWGKDDLVDWGAWFDADWPLPNGARGVRRFVGSPDYSEYLPNVGWRVNALVRVRGRGELPYVDVTDCGLAAIAAMEAQTDSTYVWTNYSVGQDNGSTVDDVYFAWSDEGLSSPPFPFPVTIPWDDLREPSQVSVFMGNRSGSSATVATITVTDPPASGVRKCRPCVFMTYGGWDSVQVILPGGASALAVHRGAAGAAGYFDSQFLIVNDRGELSGEFI